MYSWSKKPPGTADVQLVWAPYDVEVVFRHMHQCLGNPVGIRELDEVGGRKTLGLHIVDDSALSPGSKVVLG